MEVSSLTRGGKSLLSQDDIRHESYVSAQNTAWSEDSVSKWLDWMQKVKYEEIGLLYGNDVRNSLTMGSTGSRNPKWGIWLRKQNKHLHSMFLFTIQNGLITATFCSIAREAMWHYVQQIEQNSFERQCIIWTPHTNLRLVKLKKTVTNS